MHFSSTLTTLTTLATALALASQGSAFVVDVYNSGDCSGFQSFAVRTYGGPQQKGYFFVPGNCGDLTNSFGNWWVDGGDGNFQVGQCHNFATGRVMNAIASYSG
ncbi:hypothetical protein EJ02DRAFT_424049 [Clathrospora elynae]|uniref:SSCRP protein n=1 Tax=Clathrospora elynae TaxID=706981 RepID=A0A6A5ST60_9PLEO|nr:hypothetical protein EJ02DRAFT_424049 [Clathrospora elynae]